ncbi:MAG: cholest-4-en-3-one 26-monooxygenase [Actinomycetota bacterium]|jgi:cytochrome P450 family 142 subfamily A polypeptide 1|nr:cholest-4-en-3-one 26-monooxygenase [Actinomycetota bacterium]
MTAPAAPFEADALDPTLYVRGVAHDVFRWMRENDPVHRDEANGIWVVSKYEDISYVERQPELFCSGQGVRPKGGGADALSIVSMDDPEHARQRRLISRGFTGSRITQLMDHIRELARGLVDNVAAKGECDFVDDIAKQLPLIVIAEMLGLVTDQREQLAHWSDTMMAGEGAEADDPRQAAAGEAWGEYITYLVGLLEERRAEPRDDLISVLLSSADAGEISFDHAAMQSRVQEGSLGDGLGLGSDDLLAFLVLLLVAGNETTRNALSGGMLALSNFPGERDKLVADMGLVNRATEEVLRYVSPVISFSRTVTSDTELRGRTLRTGDVLLNVYPSANRDDDIFEDPDAFRVDRSPNLHLAFGTGPHFCLGANLARTEIRILLEELFTRLPDIRVPAGVDAERGANSLVTTIQHLPVEFTPA